MNIKELFSIDRNIIAGRMDNTMDSDQDKKVLDRVTFLLVSLYNSPKKR